MEICERKYSKRQLNAKYDTERRQFDNPQQISEAVAQHFSDVFSNCRNSHADINDVKDASNKVFCFSLFSEQQVLEELYKLIGTKPPFIVKGCGEIQAVPLTKIFNLAVDSSTFPIAGKVLRVWPIFKKGDQAKIENFRGVAIDAVFGRVLQSLMYQ